MDSPQVNDDTNLGINLRWLIQIIAAAGLIVWGYFGLTSKISQLEIDVMRMKDSVTMNSEFRVKWPLGQLGALPDDAEQNMRLRFIEADVATLENHVDTLRIKSVKLEQGRDDLHDPSHPFSPHIPAPHEK
tara:strand:- start:113 stop:505 length:393 start_codon:yes stop_codon:yes gene_type:complete